GRWLVAMLAAWVAALATKETAAMFPFVLVLYDAGVSDRLPATTFWRRARTVYAPLIALTVVAGLVRLFILARIEYPGQVSFHWSYLLVDADVFRRYLFMVAVPIGQAMFHEVGAISSVFDPRALVGIAAVCAFVAAIWWLRRSEWQASFGLAWFGLL